jgi:hypothetical protein
MGDISQVGSAIRCVTRAFPLCFLCSCLYISGDIVHVNVLGQHIVILNSIEAATSLLHQKASVYTNRPRLTFAGDLVGWNDLMTMAEDGPFYKDQKRLFFQELGTKAAVDRFTPNLEVQSRDFVRTVLDNPSHKSLLQQIRT